LQADYMALTGELFMGTERVRSATTFAAVEARNGMPLEPPSILTAIVSEQVLLLSAALEVPANRQAPIAAKLSLSTSSDVPISAVFDFRQVGPQTWDIAVDTLDGKLLLSRGGNGLSINGTEQSLGPEREYPLMYQHFLDLINTGSSDVDLSPLQLVADAFLCGRYATADAFED
jgi:hypothetical protein